MSENDSGVPAAVQAGSDILKNAGLGPAETQAPGPQAVEIDNAEVSTEALVQALTGENPVEPESGGEPEKTPARAEGEAFTLASIAGELGVEVSELYDVDIPMPDGADSMKLSELKDAATNYKRGELERLEFDDRVQKERNAITQAKLELQTMVAMMPASARTPQMLELAKSEMRQEREHQARELLDRVPEWKDARVYQQDTETIVEHITGFGFDGNDWGNIIDARLQAYVRHNALREQRLSQMIAKSRGEKVQTGANKTGGGKAPTQTNKTGQARNATAQRESTVSAAASLLNGIS